MKGASVIVVLIGAETAGRKWVNYEINRALSSGMGMLGVTIHNCKDPRIGPDFPGRNPFDSFVASNRPGSPRLSSIVPVYDWVMNDGYNNFGKWVEAAARAAGR
ncbi:TIR domain-containing protein [Oleiharenicola sp. Vm1]|jgi:hypothetical protein|uniref:TIR domain-containing protein n=1 Tax=Oleiharenicola sp. Vm1 TaxID=3398393 RepID=UPI0039F48032